MKKSIFMFCILCLISGLITAQDTQPNIVDDINSNKYGQGQIKIMMDESLLGLIGKANEITTNTHGSEPESTGTSTVTTTGTSSSKVRGYTIQVFSGSNQSKSRKEANAKQAQIKSAFPQLSSVISYDSPAWRLRVGSFDSRESAEATLKELKARFPSFGREMYILRQ